MGGWRMPQQVWSGVVARLRPDVPQPPAASCQPTPDNRRQIEPVMSTLTCDTCGQSARFILVDIGVSDDRWECTRCHAHRYEPHGAVVTPTSDTHE